MSDRSRVSFICGNATNIVCTPENASESYSYYDDFVLVCVLCKILFTSVVRHWLISFSDLVAKSSRHMWV